MKRILENLVCTVVLALLLSLIGIWLTRAAYWDVGSFACSFGICFVIVVEIINMIDNAAKNIQTSGRRNAVIESRKERLAMFTLFIRSSLVAHFVCAFFFFNYMKEVGVITYLPWQGGLNELPDHVLIIIVFFTFRVFAHLWYVERLLKKENYFLL